MCWPPTTSLRFFARGTVSLAEVWNHLPTTEIGSTDPLEEPSAAIQGTSNYLTKSEIEAPRSEMKEAMERARMLLSNRQD